MQNMLGKQIGNYRITAELASGSFGSVYIAKHLVFDSRFGRAWARSGARGCCFPLSMFVCPSSPAAPYPGLASSAGSTPSSTRTASATIPLSQRSPCLLGYHRGYPHQGRFAALGKLFTLRAFRNPTKLWSHVGRHAL